MDITKNGVAVSIKEHILSLQQEDDLWRPFYVVGVELSVPSHAKDLTPDQARAVGEALIARADACDRIAWPNTPFKNSIYDGWEKV